MPNPIVRVFIRAALAATLLASGHAAAMDVVIFDQPVNKADRRREYANALLSAVMERTTPEFGPYQIKHAAVHMERPRLFEALKEGKLANLTAYPATADWMRELKPVPIPIDMGLQSWRIFLIDQKSQPALRNAQTLDALGQLRAGSGSAWATLQSLQEAKLRVVTGSNYIGLFQMLMAGRFDYLPRGVNEIFAEYDTHKPANPTLAVEETLLLHDQIPSLFFVSPQEVRLHRRITAGMEALLKDGTLERLVLSYHRNDLRRAKLCGRKRFELPNRQLDPALFRRKELWLNPFEARHGFCPALLPRQAAALAF
ncbi:amino acid ABC transporter substrate-binding protein [Pseudoduganella aquatica]|uniref:Transporter substrate-binding domain-containing protein n=1 Tax=Pseudoduganella aquatica TaxID=2660641 RepID=A0A7X4HAK8_9BURK|nr:amino acid ABC transporter substrate-binding protein [Pseudoduganella aquatica]MYN07709.1 hypothetical protein [Pseudoduganella aquatica]